MKTKPEVLILLEEIKSLTIRDHIIDWSEEYDTYILKKVMLGHSYSYDKLIVTFHKFKEKHPNRVIIFLEYHVNAIIKKEYDLSLGVEDARELWESLVLRGFENHKS
jgi:hypothetical protein